MNHLRPRPFFALHRLVKGAPAVADSADMAVLLAAHPRSSIDCSGYETVRCLFVAAGGTAPTVKVQTLEQVLYEDDLHVAKEALGVMDVASAAYSSGTTFELTVNGARLFLRVDTVTGSPTKISLYVAGGKTMPRNEPGHGR